MDFAYWSNGPQTASGPLVVKDSDGQEITLSFSIQYKLKQKEIGKLYSTYQKNYETKYASYIDSTVRKIIGEFNSTKFWAARAIAGEELRDMIDKRLNDEHARCESLQLINIAFKPEREKSLIDT